MAATEQGGVPSHSNLKRRHLKAWWKLTTVVRKRLQLIWDLSSSIAHQLIMTGDCKWGILPKNIPHLVRHYLSRYLFLHCWSDRCLWTSVKWLVAAQLPLLSSNTIIKSKLSPACLAAPPLNFKKVASGTGCQTWDFNICSYFRTCSFVWRPVWWCSPNPSVRNGVNLF